MISKDRDAPLGRSTTHMSMPESKCLYPSLISTVAELVDSSSSEFNNLHMGSYDSFATDQQRESPLLIYVY